MSTSTEKVEIGSSAVRFTGFSATLANWSRPTASYCWRGSWSPGCSDFAIGAKVLNGGAARFSWASWPPTLLGDDCKRRWSATTGAGARLAAAASWPAAIGGAVAGAGSWCCAVAAALSRSLVRLETAPDSSFRAFASVDVEGDVAVDAGFSLSSSMIGIVR